MGCLILGGETLSNREPKPVLQIKDLTKNFGGLYALKDMSLDLYQDEIVGLIGPNGAGKTTLINCITGVYHPSRGDIFFNGRSILKIRPHQICRSGIARTHQIPRPFMYMTTLENVSVCARGRDLDFEYLLNLAGLWPKREILAKNLTFQDRRLLELCRALAVKPTVLLLDETVAGLNPTETADMIQVLKRVYDDFKVTILWIEHVMRAIMENANRIAVLNQGNLIAVGAPKEVANDPDVIEAYLGEEYKFEE
jgi:branched-chain amino acid transport system ATP-binding protein